MEDPTLFLFALAKLAEVCFYCEQNQKKNCEALNPIAYFICA